MEQIKGCYVSIPYGRRPDLVSGITVDYDQIYHEVIKPTVEHAGLTATRGDEFSGGALVLKSIFSAVMGSDLMIADVSAANPNVMYELGIRHATSARPTILLVSSQSSVPYHVSYTRYLRYDLDPNGTVTGPAADNFKMVLARAIETTLRTPVSFSPIFELFPEMQPNIPAGLGAQEPRESSGHGLLKRAARHSTLRAAEEKVAHEPEPDPNETLAIIKGYQEVSAWDDLVRFTDTLSEPLRELPIIVQTLALALNRRARPGDRERAEQLLSNLIDRSGGDGETFGILGRIFKDRFRESGNPEFWEKAYGAYRKGFDLQPDNYYPGVNALTLLVERGTPESRREVKQLLPRVKDALQQRIALKPPDYWDLATGLHLAAIGRDWSGARAFSDQMMKSSPSPWMVASTVNDLKALAENMAEDRDKLERLVHSLEAQSKSGEA